MDAIKLVIWDLDETFWGGTLSEGGIEYRPANHEMVIELSRRGVVNSICSKNDLETVRRVLVEKDLWDYFVFPKIDWAPKGEKIARMIDEMALRAPNVLFIDDNPQNLEEAKFYNPGLQTATPEVLDTLLEQAAVKGKDDRALSRLKQYQLLQKKVDDRQQFTSNNEDFLRQCEIRVEVRHDCQVVFDRLLEMISRTNQLNFTKARLDAEQLRQLLADQDCQCGYVQVRDRYGDYGIAGFYALRDQVLEHFLFSCRVLNMGVERWLYQRLGRPRLTIVGEVSDDPTLLPTPGWIQVSHATGADVNGATPAGSAAVGRELPRILLKGGCDLEQVLFFLGRQNGRVQGEFNYVTAERAPVHVEHTEILRRCRDDIPARFADVYGRLLFLDEKAYRTGMFDAQHDVIVYSTLMDMSAGLYRYRDSDWVVPYGDFQLNITDEANWQRVLERNETFTRDFLAWFREHFAFEGCLSPQAFADNLDWLCRTIPASKQLILLNGAEIPLEHAYEHGRQAHHRQCNAIIEQVVAAHAHVDLCDVRKFATSAQDVSNNIRHYRRGIYLDIAGELREIIARRWSLKTNPLLDLVRDWLAYVKVVGRSAAWVGVKRLRWLSPRRLTNRAR